jgi:opacity protein-like surface antigen
MLDWTNNSPSVFRLIGSDSGTQTGWTAGGGAEWAFRQNWSLKVEMDVDTQVHIARGGINYHF